MTSANYNLDLGRAGERLYWDLDRVQLENKLALPLEPSKRASHLEKVEKLWARYDFAAMEKAAEHLTAILAPIVVGRQYLAIKEDGTALHRLLYASTRSPKDRKTFYEHMQKACRLGLTLSREFEFQHPALGGSGELSPFFEDLGNRMLFSNAIAPPGQVYGDLHSFFLAGRRHETLVTGVSPLDR